MTHTRINESLLLWAIGVIQPASPREVIQFIERATRSALPADSEDGIAYQCEHYVARGLLRAVNKKKNWYSLTHLGDVSIPKELRRRRDRMRLFLLKTAAHSRIALVGASDMRKLIDDSSIEQRSDVITQEVPRPTKSCNRDERGHERFRWPRIFEQISKGSGSATDVPTATKSANPLIFYTYSPQHRAAVDNPYPINAKELALAIGVSARLLTSISKVPDRYYRQFEISKSNGTPRKIASPKLFLKVIQYWIKDYLFYRLPVHTSCYSFVKNTSIEDNARPHVGMKYVATIDIEDFFGSINQNAVQNLIKRTGHTIALSRIVAKLTTLDDALPQGAPTSPIISNSFLFKFDQSISRWCGARECSYSRYADDITISGNSRETVVKCIERATHLLRRLGLNLNEHKTRMQSRGGRQSVTGLTVNERAQPSREQRRKVRAMLHQYQCGKLLDAEKIASLRGWVSYLRSFDHLKEKFEIE